MAFASGGRSGSPASRSPSSSLTSVRFLSCPAPLSQSNSDFAGFVYFASWTYFVSTYFHNLPSMGKCAGEEFAAFSGIGILSSYLFLFISFYFATYKKDGKRPSGRKAVRRMSQAPFPDAQTIMNASSPSAKSSGVKTNGTSTRSRRA